MMIRLSYRRILLTIGVMLFTTASMMGQETSMISGTIRSKEGEPIRDVTVSVIDAKITVRSAKDGSYEIRNVTTGTRQLQFSFKGYISKQLEVSFEAGNNYNVDVVLEKDFFLLSEVTVSRIINKGGEVKRLEDVHNTFIIAGKKNEVIQVDGMNANIAEKTGRQVFAKIPGTFVYDMDGSGNQVNISTRGLDPHRSWEYNIRQNGITTNSDIYGYPASHYSAPLESIRKVEIVRGTASLQYGASFGGMINYVTKSPDTTRKISFENITSLGSFGLLSTYNAVGGKVGKLSYYAYLSLRKSDGYRDNARSNYNAQYAGLSYALSDNIKLKAEVGHVAYVYQIPGPLTDSMFYAEPRHSTRSRNYFSPDIYIPSLSLDWQISASTRLSVIASGVLGKRNSVQLLGFATLTDTINRNTGKYVPRQVDIDGFNSYTSEIRLLHKYSLGGFRNVLTTGVRLIHNNLHRRQLGVGTTGSNLDLALSQPGFGRDLHFKTKNVAVFAENLFSITKSFSISPGFRYENGTSAMEGTITYYDPGNVPNKVHHQFPLFGVSSQYALSKSSRLYAGWAQAYRPVLFADIIPATPLDSTDKNLLDAKGHTFELGTSGNLGKGVNFDIGLFAIRYNNRMGSLIDVNANGDSYVLKTNVGSSLTKGMELFVEINPGAIFETSGDLTWSVFTSTSYMDARYKKGVVVSGGVNKSIEGNLLETVPRWISRNGLNIAYRGFSSTIQYSYVSESYSDALNTRTPNATGSAGLVPSYSLLDINSSYRFNRDISLKFGFNNVLDKQYFTKRPSGYPGPGVWPSDGRSVVATLHVKL